MSKNESKAIALKGSANIAVRESRVGQGSENVSATDMAIPRLKLLQAISDEVTEGSASYIEGAKAGMIMNSVTRELSTGIFAINLHFDKKVVVWKKRKLGGGMFGTFDARDEAEEALKAANEPLENYDISDNPSHLVLILGEDGKPKGIAILDMPGSKIKVSKRWNTLINEQEELGNPRFGCVWSIDVKAEESSDGPYKNYDISLVAQAPDEIYQEAAKAYDNFFRPTPVDDGLDEAA